LRVAEAQQAPSGPIVGAGWFIYQRAQVHLFLESDGEDPSSTRVIAVPGSRLGAALALAGYAVVVLLPLVFLPSNSAREGYAVFGVIAVAIPTEAVAFVARVEIWSALKQLHLLLPADVDAARSARS